MQISNTAEPVDFSFLDQSEFQQKYVLNNNQVRFYVGGIRCGKCVRKLEDLPMTVPGLMQLRVEMGENLATAEIDSSQLTLAGLTQKISDLGFKPVPLAVTDSSAQVRNLEDRNDLIRLAVAGACAGNIMTFSFATYFGETGAFLPLFNWLSFALYIPVVSYVALPFYRGAWNSLKQKQVSIDLPMAVASLAGFTYSFFELLRGGQEIYFDSLSGFLFLILVSRWGQKKMQRHFLRAREIMETFSLEKVKRLTLGSWAWARVDHLKHGDLIRVAAGDTLPAEGELISENGHFSLAWISGELKSKTYLRGALVPAGARVQSSAEFKITKLLPETPFGKILHEVQKFNLSKNRLVSQADIWAQWLLITVFSVAVVFLIAYWNTSSADAIQRSLALIILACPCAMAFGTPLALAAALKKSHAAGLIIRNANVFEKIRKVNTIYLDKTGTLTETELSLVNPEVPESQRKIILALENNSHHPIAFAFRRAFSYTGALPEVKNPSETPGYGVSGTIDGVNYKITAGQPGSGISCELLADEVVKYKFTFTAALKPDSLWAVEELRRRGYRVCLLSGDRKDSVLEFGAELGFTMDDIFYAADPAKKAEVVAATPGAMMVGDGMNDSLAMIKAEVGVATSGGVEAALRSSDVYLTRPSLRQLLRLIDVSKESLALIRQNLVISVIYNVIGGGLALAGFVNPFVAAVLMPVSSGFIILSTWLRSRA